MDPMTLMMLLHTAAGAIKGPFNAQTAGNNQMMGMGGGGGISQAPFSQRMGSSMGGGSGMSQMDPAMMYGQPQQRYPGMNGNIN